MKLNTVNKLYIFISIFFIVGILYTVFNNQDWNRQYYSSSVCAPDIYPVYTRNIYFVDKQNELISINNEDVNRQSSNWGEAYYFPETYRKQLLPHILVIEYVTFPDKQYYYDSLILPQSSTDSIFQALVKQNETIEIYNRGNHKQGLSFLIGIANEGNIAIWLRGKNKEVLISKYQTKPREPQMLEADGLKLNDFYNSGFEFIDDSLKTHIIQSQKIPANYIDSPTHFYGEYN